MRIPFLPAAAAVSVLSLLAACGGGADAPGVDATAAAPDASVAALRQKAKARPAASADAERIAAVTATANSSVNACNPIRPFYWEVGAAGGAKASGSVSGGSGRVGFTATTPIAIASASKWVYGAYVVEKRNGQPTASDRKFLSMESGYVSMRGCQRGQTVDGCLNAGNNGDYSASFDGRFFYGGGHMQKHASTLGLGDLDSDALAAELRSRLGRDVLITMNQPQLAGGMVMTPHAYATFLRKILSGSLKIGGLLGSQAVCAAPDACGRTEAVVAPIQDSETFHYALGHWVEDDAQEGDGAFSSAGAFGFYPWINAAKTGYGIVARADHQGEHAGWESMLCGRLIRKAWATGVAQ